MNSFTNTIVFFGKELSINPVAFYIGEKPIYWYGIIIAMGFLLALIYGLSEAKRTGFSQDDIMNIVLIATPVSIITARVYYVIFNWSRYKGNFMEIIAVWKGGIAIYGALIGAVITGLLYCRYKKISFLKLADIACGGLFIGQFVGRWGNFVNSEAYGAETSLPWKMGVEEFGEIVYVHPTFLYESLWNMMGFVIVFILRKHKKFDGQLFYFYIFWYGLGRVWIEALRTDSLYFGTFRVSQIVALFSILAGAVLMFAGMRKYKKDRDIQKMQDKA